jgi:hypothetical protein
MSISTMSGWKRRTARMVGASRWAIACATLGPLLVVTGIGTGIALGHSPSWFAAVGIPGNLLWLVGLIGLGRATARSRAMPRWVAYALPLSVIALLPFGELGGSILTAALWAWLAHRANAAQERTTQRRAALGRA